MHRTLTLSLPLLLAATARAGQVGVHATGTVVFTSASSGPLGGTQVSDPVAMDFQVFTPGFETSPSQFESFTIDKPTFVLDIGGVQVGLGNGSPGLGIGNGFPVADGTFIFVTPINVQSSAFEFELHDSTGTVYDSIHIAALHGAYAGAAFDTVDWNVFTGGGQIAIALSTLVFDLEIAPAVGTSYCTSLPNSSGQPAVIATAGSASVSAQHLTLTGTQLPPFKSALFFYGPLQTQTPLGSGNLCVTGGIYRLQPVVQSDAAGTIVHVIDWNQAPVGSGAGAILAGSTWNFQAWFRDPPSTNLTDARSVTFVP